MKIKIIPEWRAMLRHAWSIRLLALGFVFAGAQALIDIFGIDAVPFVKGLPTWAKMLIVMVIMGGAFVAKFVIQPKMRDKAKEKRSDA